MNRPQQTPARPQELIAIRGGQCYCCKHVYKAGTKVAYIRNVHVCLECAACFQFDKDRQKWVNSQEFK